MKNVCLVFLFAAVISSGCKDDVIPEHPASLPDNHINAIYIDSDGVKYFATDKGLASFDGTSWKVFHDNSKITKGKINDLAFELTMHGPELWLATSQGVNVATLPVDATSGATTYTSKNTETLFPGQATLKGDSVTIIHVDDKHFRWVGSNKGVAVFKGNTWPPIQMGNHYNPGFFTMNRITSAGSTNDTTYVGTYGGGVARFKTNDVDAVTAASPLEIPWSMLPSNNILSVHIDGAVRWFGTDEGLAKHWGKNAKKGWMQFYVSDGLLSNRIQCITKDPESNLWIGTPEGISVFDGENWYSYTVNNGLAGNDVRCMAVDIDGTLWIGTTKGVSHFNGSSWVTYTAE
jgi:ligand-binding sensor domain-containing protein